MMITIMFFDSVVENYDDQDYEDNYGGGSDDERDEYDAGDDIQQWC